MFGEEVLLEIDATLDQLIQNAETIQDIDLQSLSDTEIDAFQKTQESLLHRLLRMDQVLESKRNELKVQNKHSAGFKIQQKRLKFETLKSKLQRDIEKSSFKMPILLKRKGKKLLLKR